jgi:hypothetical protein
MARLVMFFDYCKPTDSVNAVDCNIGNRKGGGRRATGTWHGTPVAESLKANIFGTFEAGQRGISVNLHQ